MLRRSTVLALAVALTVAGAAAAAVVRAEEDAGAEVTVDVEIPELGVVRGVEGVTAQKGVKFYKFLGIPYAAKPERFQPPTAFARWGGDGQPLDATRHARSCPDLGLSLLASSGAAPLDAIYPGAAATLQASRRARLARAHKAQAEDRAEDDHDDEDDQDPEDCLTIDIYTHSTNASRRAPVLLYVHGGAFVLGSSAMANGDFLLEHGPLVLASVQYRLGPAGFLASETAKAPGNAALHDLRWALLWLRQHVHVFGGDPAHVVVGGVSAGAALSGLLAVSPATRGMLSGVALFSGGALVPWAVDSDAERSARGVGVFAGCLGPDDLHSCLRSRSATALNIAWALWTTYEKYFVSHGMGGVIPALDPETDAPVSMLPRPPAEEMQRSDFQGLPLLVGVTKHEGAFLMAQVDIFYMKARALTQDKFTLENEVGDLLIRFSDVEDHLFVLGDAVKRLYFAEERLGNYSAMFEGFVDFTGAGFFKGPAQRTAQLNALAGGASYLYSFDYAGENMSPDSLMGGDAHTVHHGSDQSFLFRNPAYKYSERDLQIVDAYCQMVASFVQDLRPSLEGVQWRPHTLLEDHYLSVALPLQPKQHFADMFYVTEQERRDSEDDGDDDDDDDDDATSTTDANGSESPDSTESETSTMALETGETDEATPPTQPTPAPPTSPAATEETTTGTAPRHASLATALPLLPLLPLLRYAFN